MPNPENYLDYYDKPIDEILPNDAKRIIAAQECYMEIVKFAFEAMKRHGLTQLAKSDVSSHAFSDIEHLIKTAVRDEIRNFSEIGIDIEIDDILPKFEFEKLYDKLRE